MSPHPDKNPVEPRRRDRCRWVCGASNDLFIFKEVIWATFWLNGLVDMCTKHVFFPFFGMTLFDSIWTCWWSKKNSQMNDMANNILMLAERIRTSDDRVAFWMALVSPLKPRIARPQQSFNKSINGSIEEHLDWSFKKKKQHILPLVIINGVSVLILNRQHQWILLFWLTKAQGFCGLRTWCTVDQPRTFWRLVPSRVNHWRSPLEVTSTGRILVNKCKNSGRDGQKPSLVCYNLRIMPLLHTFVTFIIAWTAMPTVPLLGRASMSKATYQGWSPKARPQHIRRAPKLCFCAWSWSTGSWIVMVWPWSVWTL